MDRSQKEILDNLRQVAGDENVSIIKNKNSTRLTINIRKCLALRVVLDKEMAICTSARLYVSETKNLKPERTKVIEEFLDRANASLCLIVDEARISILNDLYTKCAFMLVGEDFLKESFDVIETKSKICTFKFDDDDEDDNRSKKSVLNNTTDTDAARKTSIVDTKDDHKSQPKFKGSDYIFQRIKWDANIDKKQVVIGYLDRFSGIKHIKFEDFKGVHEDYKEGVPFHRIRYFKINERIVWDREQKIDLLTGSGEAIVEFFEKKEPTVSSDNYDNDDDALIEDFSDGDDNEVFVDGDIYKFNNNQWSVCGANETTVGFIDEFKLLTYNLMSKVNFKKSILSKMKFKKSQLEVMNRALEDEDEYGLKALEKIDRMEVILKSMRENDWDFLILQECDQYEETRLKEDEFIQNNYFICSMDRKSARIEHPNCVILSKQQPALFKFLKLTNNSNKYALLAKYNVGVGRGNSSSSSSLLVVNVHLSSNKVTNFVEKRRTQLETLKRYVIDQASEFDLDATHCLISGDFNFGDAAENAAECALMRDLFEERHGFRDLVARAYTFEPERNFATAVTAFNMQPRRLDRVMYKSSSSSSPLRLIEAYLINTAPFKVNVASPVLYQPYLSIRSYTEKNRIKIDQPDSLRFD